MQELEALVVLEEVQQAPGRLLAEVEADQAAPPSRRGHNSVVRAKKGLGPGDGAAQVRLAQRAQRVVQLVGQVPLRARSGE